MLPKLLGSSNAGKVFYLTFHPCWEISSEDNSIKIYISSQFVTNVKLEIADLGISRKKKTIANGVIEFSLTPEEAQMYSKGDGVKPIPPYPEHIWQGCAIKITADDPILCYGVTRFKYVADGFLALPVHCLGKSYQVASYADYSDNKSMFLPSYTSIIAAYNNTKVSFKLCGNSNTRVPLDNGDTLSPGETLIKTLNQGDVWLIPGIGEFNDLSGSIINADKDIAVISGNFCAQVPVGVKTCDYLLEQEIPTEFWGKKYFVPTIINRIAPSIIKIFAKEPNTSISVNNVPMFNISNIDGIPGTGYIETRTTPDNKAALISSNKNINVVLYNTSPGEDLITEEPFQMNIVPEEQYQTEVIFFTPGIIEGTKFDYNILNIIYKAKSKEIPNDLMFGFKENETIRWSKFSDYISNYTIESFYKEQPDSKGFLHYSVTFMLPKDSIFRLKADNPFCLHGYGFTANECYGFPLSLAMKEQTYQDEQTPVVDVHTVGVGNYVGDITEFGGAGLSFVEMINGLSFNYKFERDDFIPGNSMSINYKLTKISNNQDSKAVIYISDRSGNDTTIVLESFVSAKSLIPEISAKQSNFGYVKNGEIKQLTFKLTNTSNVSSKSVENIVLKSDSIGFRIVHSLKFPFILKAGESVDFSVEFKGTTENGAVFTSIGIVTMDTTVYSQTITGTVANPSIYVTDIDFGEFHLGSTASNLSFTLSNKGYSTLEIYKIDFPVNSAYGFNITPPTKENPLKVSNDGYIQYNVSFKPTKEGFYKDSIVFYTNDNIIKNVCYLTGNAIINSVEDYESKFGSINIYLKDDKIKFNAKDDVLLNYYAIYDLKGDIIQKGSPLLKLDNMEIQLDKLSKSVYFIELNTNFGKLTKKIFVD